MSLNRFKDRFSTLSKLGEKKLPQNQPPQMPVGVPTWPIMLQILPQDGLQALVFHHTIDTPISGLLHCWTYISQGMIKVGQKEIVFTVRRRVDNEGEGNYPQDPLRWYETVYSQARHGQLVGEFQRTEFTAPYFLGRSDIKWIMYVPQRPINNVPPHFLPPDWIQAIPLLAPEAEVAERFGVMRALSHMGNSQRWFPWPPWFDRDRTACIAPPQMHGSIRAQVSYAIIAGISAVKKDTEFVFFISEKAESGIKEVLETFQSNHALPLDCVHYQNADSGLLWCNTDVEPRGYGSGTESSCTNLNSFTFCPGQEQNELKIIEDGCVFMLKTDTYIDIREQLSDFQPVSITLPEGEVFHVEYGRHSKPAPASEPVTPQYKPETPSPAPPVAPSVASSVAPSAAPSLEPPRAWHVHRESVTPLDSNVTSQTEALVLSSYIENIDKALDTIIPKAVPPGAEGGGRVLIEADVGGPDRWDKLGRRWITIHFTPPPLGALPLDEMQEKLTNLETPNIEPRTRFQVLYHVWGFVAQ